MKSTKQFFCLLTLVLLSFALLAGCNGKEPNIDTLVFDAVDTVVRNGEQIDVRVYHDEKAIYFYYNDEDHKLFDTAEFPTDKIHDDNWRNWNLTVIFSDATDGNSSCLEAYLDHGDMSESHIVWQWEEGKGYVCQPDSSEFYKRIVLYYPDDNITAADLYKGLWLGGADSQYDYIGVDENGDWQLYSGGDVIDDGYLWYEGGTTYIYSYRTGAADGGQVVMEGQQLYITTLGYFDYGGEWDGGDRENTDAGNENSGSYSWNSELRQRNVSEFEGVWYYDEDPAAALYIVIDGAGNWSYYQRTPGDAEAAEMDCGTFSYSSDEINTYYANSAKYKDLSIRVFEVSENVLVWGDEDVYYRME